MRRQRRKERRRKTLKSTFRNIEPLEDRRLLAADFGDAPAPYPLDAEHTATGPRLGAFRDMEASGIPSLLADSDGADEDGVAFGLMRIGQQATISVNTQNHSDDVWLNAWVDFNRDGNWGGAGEQILDSYRKAPGDKEIFFDVPSWSASGATYARIRVSTTGQLGHGGTATDGEVEDYVIDIEPAFGLGTFPLDERKILPGNADGAFTVAAADIDGDGDQDVISGSRSDNSIRWYENVNGTFGPNSDRLVTSGADGVRSVFAADINGDGLMDIVAGSTNDDTIAWYRQRPFQMWAKEVIFTDADSVREVTAADMDGDGDMDILSASVNDDMIRWYRNDGGAGFTVQDITIACGSIQRPCTQVTPRTMNGARAVAAADMDADGDMDVVAAAYNDDMIAWFERTGANRWIRHVIDTTADGASSVAIADLDGDGNMDIAAASQLDDTVAWYESNGVGGFTKHTVSAFVPSAIDVIAADMDGDGYTDLVVGRNEGASIDVHLNDGIGNFERASVDVSSSIFLNVRPIAVAAADFTGDGALDIVTAELGSNRFAVYPKLTNNYEITDVPDFDQRRATQAVLDIFGLPNDGSMYCVPTAAANWMAYIANHGYPNLAPGIGDWSQQSHPSFSDNYQTITDTIDTLGDLMSTDPQKGTTGTSARSGIQAYLDSAYPGSFVVSNFWNSNSSTVRFDDLVASASLGNLIMPAVGWYSNLESKTQKLVDKEEMSPFDASAYLSNLRNEGVCTSCYERNGGHVISMVQAQFTHDGQKIGFHDPNTPKSESMLQQSTFSKRLVDVVGETGVYNDIQTTVDRFVGYGSGRLDGYVSIRPRNGLVVVGNQAIFLSPVQFGTNLPLEHGIRLDHNILDIAMQPELTWHPYVPEGRDEIRVVDQATETSWHLAEVARPKRLVIGGQEQAIYVLGESELVRLTRDGDEVANTRTSVPYDAIAYLQDTDELVAYSSETHTLDYYNQDLRHLRAVNVMPPGGNPPSDARVTVSISPQDGSLWIHHAGSRELSRLQFDGLGEPEQREVTLEDVSNPESIAVDDQGILYVSDGGVLQAFDANGRAVDSLFNETRGGSVVQILQSFESDVADQSDHAYRNVLPPDAGDETQTQLVQYGDRLIVTGTGDADTIALVDMGTVGIKIQQGDEETVFTGIRSILVHTANDDDIVSYELAEQLDSLLTSIYIDGGDGVDEFHSLSTGAGRQPEIELIRIGNAPALSDQVFRIPDSTSDGESVGTIVFHDPDPRETHRFEIVGGDGSNVFRLNERSGDITVAESPELGRQSTWHLRIQVTDSSGLSDTAVVRIEVVEQNEASPGDFNRDMMLGCADIDALVAAIVSGRPPSQFDLTEDGTVNQLDVDEWLAVAGAANLPTGNAYLRGDANLDGIVDSADLNMLGLNWQQRVTGWCEADFNADGNVNSADLNAVGLNWQVDANEQTRFGRAPRAALAINMAATTRPADRLATSESESGDSASTLPPEYGPLDHCFNRKQFAINERRKLRSITSNIARFAERSLENDVFESTLDATIKDWN